MLQLPSYGLGLADVSTCLPILTSVKGGKGLGDAKTTNQIIGLTSTAVGTTGSILAATGMLAAIPIAGPFIAAAAALIPIIASFFQGCGQSCIQETAEVNQIEPYLQQNVQAYLALPIPRTQAEQQAALAVFDSAQAQITQFCGQSQFGQSGQNCISERFNRSSCQWKDSSGNCWNWVIGYRDPIANDPHVASGTSVSELMQSGGSLVGGLVSNPLAIIGGIALLAGVFMFSGSKGRS